MFKRISEIRKNKTAKNSMVFVIALMLTHLFNISFNIYLGRSLEVEDFGLVTLIVSVLYFTNIILLALSATASHTTAYLFSNKKNKALLNFYQITKKNSLLVTLLFSLIWIAATPSLSRFFNMENYLPLILFTPIFSLGTILSVNRGFLQGKIKFAKAGLLFLSEALSKLIIAIFLTIVGFGEWAYLAIPISILIAFSISIIITKNETNLQKTNDDSLTSFPKKFFAAATVSRLSTMAFLGLDFMLIKHFFNSEEAGYYALLSLSGKIIFFLGEISNNFTIPLVSKNMGKGKDPSKIFTLIFIITSFFVILSTIIFGVFGKYTAPAIFGEKALVIIPLLPTFAFAIAGFTIANCIVTYHLAKKQYLFPLVSIFSAILTAIGIVLYHNSLAQVVSVIAVMSAVNFISIIVLHLFLKKK